MPSKGGVMFRAIGVALLLGVVFSGCSQKMILSGIFWDIDKDNSGTLDILEYHDTRRDFLQEEAKEKGMSTMELAKKEFQILDTNGNALLSKKEFFDDEKIYNK